MGNGRRRSRRREGALALLIVAPLLTGCGLLGGGSQPPLDEERTSWQHDVEADRWYVPAGVFTDRGIIETAFPELTPNVGLWTSGRVSDPTSRITVAGPDDHWSQYVIQLDAQEAERLQSDSSGATVRADEVSATLVPTMEEIAGTCRADWMDVTDGLATGQGSAPALGNDEMIDMAALCPSTGVVAVSTIPS